MKQGEALTLEIESINSEGEGIARCGAEHFVVFVAGALPGEKVKCLVEKATKKYAAARTLEVLKPADVRVTPKCPVYSRCGGCQLQHASYGAQLAIKAKILSDAMRRIARIELPKGLECVPSPAQWGYRNKTTLPVSQTRRGPLFGYYERRSHRIVPFATCPVLLPSLEKIAREGIQALSSSGLKGYDERSGAGELRHVAARSATYAGVESALFGIVTKHDPQKREFGRLRDLCQKLGSSLNGSLAGTVLNVNGAPGNFIWGPQFKSLCGARSITQTLNELDFRIDISAFFQINAPQAAAMFAYAGQLAKRAAPANVLELYSGVGRLTAHLARVADRVEAVEEWRPSVRLLEDNLALNGIENVQVHADSAEQFMQAAEHGSFEAVVLDPPRTGCDESVIEGIRRVAPKTVVYVSCNPATLVRDVSRLVEGGEFEFESVKAFDMFPQTAHVESVALLHSQRQ